MGKSSANSVYNNGLSFLGHSECSELLTAVSPREKSVEGERRRATESRRSGQNPLGDV